MARHKKVEAKETIFTRESEVTVDGRLYTAGDIIKIDGEHGGKFKFHSLVTNTETGAQWVDCFELQKGVASAYRSFKVDRMKRIPKKRARRSNNGIN
jgi:hypothetical protein